MRPVVTKLVDKNLGSSDRDQLLLVLKKVLSERLSAKKVKSCFIFFDSKPVNADELTEAARAAKVGESSDSSDAGESAEAGKASEKGKAPEKISPIYRHAVYGELPQQRGGEAKEVHHYRVVFSQIQNEYRHVEFRPPAFETYRSDPRVSPIIMREASKYILVGVTLDPQTKIPHAWMVAFPNKNFALAGLETLIKHGGFHCPIPSYWGHESLQLEVSYLSICRRVFKDNMLSHLPSQPRRTKRRAARFRQIVQQHRGGAGTVPQSGTRSPSFIPRRSAQTIPSSPPSGEAGPSESARDRVSFPGIFADRLGRASSHQTTPRGGGERSGRYFHPAVEANLQRQVAPVVVQPRRQLGSLNVSDASAEPDSSPDSSGSGSGPSGSMG